MTRRSPGPIETWCVAKCMRDPVAHDAACQQGGRADLGTARGFGDEVGGDVADSDPAQRVGFEVDAGQRDCGPPGVGKAAMAQLQQHVGGLGAGTVHHLSSAKGRGLGRSAVTKAVRYAEQRGGPAYVDRDRKVAAHLLAG